MKRHIVILVVFLLLGAIVNIAVACGLTAWHWTPRLQKEAFQWELQGTQRLLGWAVHRGDEVGRIRIKSTWFEGPMHGTMGHGSPDGDPEVAVLRWSTFLRPIEEDRTGTPISHCRVVDAAGWPMLSMWCCVKAKQVRRLGLPIVDTAALPDCDVVGGLELQPVVGMSTRDEPWRALPLTPLWPGFAINTLFYAAILWLLFAAPFVLRRMRRIRRGLCPACAYPVGTSDLCTECGKPVTPRSVEPAPS